MNYLAALNKSTCDVVQPVKQVVDVIIKQETVPRCMSCSVKLNKPGVCARCTKFCIAYGKCDFCKLIKLTISDCCKECMEESDDEDDACKVCGDTDKTYGSCLTCVKEASRSER